MNTTKGTESNERLDSKTRSIEYGDLVLILASGILLGWLLSLSVLFPSLPSSPVNWLIVGLCILLGIPFVLFIPGYLLQCALFPMRDDLDSIERVGISMGLSVVLVTLLALLLNALPWGLRPWPIIIGQMCLIVVLIVVTVIVRKMVPAEKAYNPQVRPHPSQWWTSLTQGERTLMFAMAGTFLIMMLTAAWIFLKPSTNALMTEFYILGKEGLAEEYPREITAGEVVKLTTGITNREGVDSTYNIQVKLDEQVIGKAGPIFLENGATWEQAVKFSVPTIGEDQQIQFILDREGQPSPYRLLKLWLNVIEAQAP